MTEQETELPEGHGNHLSQYLGIPHSQPLPNQHSNKYENNAAKSQKTSKSKDEITFLPCLLKLRDQHVKIKLAETC